MLLLTVVGLTATAVPPPDDVASPPVATRVELGRGRGAGVVPMRAAALGVADGVVPIEASADSRCSMNMVAMKRR